MAEQTRTSIDKVKELAPTVSLFILVVVTITLSVTSQINIGDRLGAMQAETNRRFDELNRRFDELLEALRIFEGRISRLEEQMNPAE